MRVLLLDAAFSALPIYESLVGCGHEVWVMGNRLGDILAKKAGDHWIQQDYSQVSKVERHVERLGIDRIVPGCTDVSISTCVQLGSDYIDSAESSAVLMNKKLFRDLCADLGLPAPRAQSADRLPAPGKFICKPVDAFSGRGISVFDGLDRTAMLAAFALARRESACGEALAETFVEGDLYSYTTFLERGVPQECFYVREASSINPFAVDTSYVSESLPENCRTALANAIVKIAEALNLGDGLIHTQFLWNGQIPAIVEIARRCPGDLYSLLIEYSTGFRYAEKYASYFLGVPCETSGATLRHVLRHTATDSKAVCFSGLLFCDPLPIKAFFPLRRLGEDSADGHVGRLGVLFCEFADRNDMYLAESKFLQRTSYEVEASV